MLLEFRTKNYKSFKQELVFSMIPAPKQKGQDYSILEKKIGTKKYKALPTAVIYGANASGKSNIIGAMDTFKSILLRGNIRNSTNNLHPNIASDILELIPNIHDDSPEPLFFSMSFIKDELFVEYEISIDIGKFLENNYERKIINEKLSINKNLIYNRGETLEFGNLKSIKNYWNKGYEDNANSAKSLAENNLNDIELFLTTAFKSMFSSKLVDSILNWIENKFTVIFRADSITLSRILPEYKRHTIYIDDLINSAAKLFGVRSNDLGYIASDDEKESRLCSIFGKKNVVSSDFFESYGTIRFINIFPIILDSILYGKTLIIDELDASIHPMAIMSIINVFHNDDINKNNAQLIFNTHNTSFLNSNLFRRDEIKFVERDDETHFSTHYSLSDFGTTGENGVRKNEDYMDKYFINRYGAIKDIDFTPLFEDYIENKKM